MIKKLIEEYKALIAKAKNEGYTSPKEMPLDYLEEYVSLYKQIKLAEHFIDKINDIRNADLTVKKHDEIELINEMEAVNAEKLAETSGYGAEVVLEKFTEMVNPRSNRHLDIMVDQDKWYDHYAEITAKWLASKTEQQQKIWKLHFEGMPKKTIAEKLRKDPKYVRVTIKRLTKDLIKKLPPLLNK